MVILLHCNRVFSLDCVSLYLQATDNNSSETEITGYNRLKYWLFLWVRYWCHCDWNSASDHITYMYMGSQTSDLPLEDIAPLRNTRYIPQPAGCLRVLLPTGCLRVLLPAGYLRVLLPACCLRVLLPACCLRVLLPARCLRVLLPTRCLRPLAVGPICQKGVMQVFWRILWPPWPSLIQ